jgi:uncharacterized membrane protein (UPF0136 family)
VSDVFAPSGAALHAFRPAGEGGWIGYWTPGIGDPTIAGWLTVVLYFAAAVVCFRVGRNREWGLSRSEVSLFRLLTLGLVALGVNKQLDLQTALTELGRMVAAEGDWYDQRRGVQKAFIMAVGLTALAMVASAAVMMRRMPMATHVTTVGALGLVAFVVIRASSLHHVDLFIHGNWHGVRANWVIEIGSLLVVITGAWWRARLLRQRA